MFKVSVSAQYILQSMNKNHWSMSLVKAMADQSVILASTDQVVAIKDKYPKAKYHFLVLPKEEIPSIFHLKREHLPLLSEIHLLAINAIEVYGGNRKNFKIGFHASPSMQRLHLHVISDDFVSNCLKTKTHWNSFNTNFFLKFEDVYEEIKHNGKLKELNKDTVESLMKSELVCNKCSFRPKNMPDLKQHLLNH